MQARTIDILKDGGIGVLPTDTIYGLVGRADLPETVERIYRVRRRDPEKQCIILVSSYEDIEKFGVELSAQEKKLIEEKWLWPGKVSIVLGERAFRMPAVPALLDLLKQTGPLIAPSANLEGEPPAKNIGEARAYFGDAVDFYEDGGELNGEPSTLIKFEEGKIVVLREGAVRIKQDCG